MRKLLIALSVILSFGFASQAAMLEDGMKWIDMSLIIPHPNVGGYVDVKDIYKIEIAGDTIVKGKVYKKITIDLLNIHMPPQYSGKGVLYTLMREEGKKIYYIGGDDTDEMLVYDFGLEPGEECTYYDFYPYNSHQYEYRPRRNKCVGKTTVTSCGKTYDVLQMEGITAEGTYGGEGLEWVEGIGTIYGMMFQTYVIYGGIFDPKTDPTIQYRTWMFDSEGNLMFDLAEANNNFYGPAGVAPTVAPERNSARYGLDGLQIDDNAKGIYISGGKKYINK